MKVRSLVKLSNHSAFRWWSVQCSACMLLLSDDLMGCCAARTIGWLDLRRRAFPPGGQVGVVWSRWPDSMARHAKESVAHVRRSSAGWMLAKIGTLSVGVRRRHPVTIRKASLMAGSTWRKWTLEHHAKVQYSAAEWIRARVAIRSFVAQHPI